MFTCIFIRSNYLAKHTSPVSALQVQIKTITKLLVNFCIDKPSQYFFFCPSTYNKSLVPFLWPLVNGFTTSWPVLWVVDACLFYQKQLPPDTKDWQSSQCSSDHQREPNSSPTIKEINILGILIELSLRIKKSFICQ